VIGVFIDFLTATFDAHRDADAIVWQDRAYSYGWLLGRVRTWQRWIEAEAIAPGAVAALEADFSPNAVALLLALVEARCTLVPLTAAVAAKKTEFLETAEAELVISLDAADEAALARRPCTATHPLYAELRSRQHPGLVLFSSGSTGKSKAAVHDLVGILEKFRVPRHARRTIAFLMFDHIGGINTLLYTLANAGCTVTVQDRSPEAVLGAVEKHRVELLPTSPTFLNLVFIGEACKHYDLSSLKLITYGTEPMPESTLRRLRQRYPHVELLQTYGLSEVGILRSKSKDSDSLWVKLGGEGFAARVGDGILQGMSRSAMLGYLNAPNPFAPDGWLVTGDVVQEDGEYLRILGRHSEIINVGGQKVYPAEVESVIEGVENVAGAVVFGEPNALVGNIVCARVALASDEDPKEATRRVKQVCRSRLPAFAVPVKVLVVDEVEHTERFKKRRLPQ
jgi:acyl-coenzyme A synthetase/AMP-(fatty) acid ligase